MPCRGDHFPITRVPTKPANQSSILLLTILAYVVGHIVANLSLLAPSYVVFCLLVATFGPWAGQDIYRLYRSDPRMERTLL
ncbi:hypothetical protein EJ05DRAFT_472086 [Pseudovirgaria hyperparasitica]|uniref:Uncharacterized protein n=1 Tax=Pseudovirgaria hyperparasitica TaxID=470096 RepID=A0A6A6WLS9_9PEZI|nr:uncharacterized protein EJ05DRAFT_472086 [Pseudovirgaria hyperparasitica]KAF2763164.1 hypothetical protein EJ05DRAFT_472086 [Pseudovirgaria hyperparasitica]